MSTIPPATLAHLNGESASTQNGRSSTLPKKPSYSQFPIPPGSKGWHEGPRRRTMENGRVSPYTLSVAAEFSLKRANRQLTAMGETLESAKSDLSPVTSGRGSVRSHSRSSSAPITPLKNADRYSASGDMLGDMRKLAIELRTLRESIDPARRGSISSVGSTSRGSTPLTSPRNVSRFKESQSVETPRTSPRHSRHSSVSGLPTLREEQPVIEVQTIRGHGVGQPSAVVRIFRSMPKEHYREHHSQAHHPESRQSQTNHTQIYRFPPDRPQTHQRSLSESNGINIRHYDGTRDKVSPKGVRIPEIRPESEQSMISVSSYHSALQGLSDSESDMNGHVSDTATIGARSTPIPRRPRSVRDVGVNTEDILPAETIPPQPLRQRPSRAALLSNIRGGQDGILLARLHGAVDKLAHELASTSSQNPEEDANTRRKLQAALDLLEATE